MIIGGSSSQDLAAHVARELDEELCYVETKKFPDGERYLRIAGEIEDEVTVIQSTGYPQDENLMELLFIISNLKDLGAKKLVLHLWNGIISDSNIDYNIKALNREIKWKDEPAIIADMHPKLSYIMIVPDLSANANILKFDGEYAGSKNVIFTTVFDKHIDWWRD